ncbi:MAG: FAD-dependent oxidoreductase [Chitinophagaceae bacterium]|nr:FAD-dependent oxidoreductase [Chitinophagaceae bacterium]
MKQTVIIVGAGAAGLIAARELSGKKFNVTVLESRQYAGGRIQTHDLPGSDGVVEGGAEFIHGKLPVTLDLCEEAKIEYIPAEGKMYRREKNEWVEETEMIEGWDELIKKMGSLKDDMTLYDFLIEYYPEDKYTDLRMHIISYVQGFDLADPEKVSVSALYEEWSHEEEDNFRIPEGYKKLVQFLESKCLDNGCIIIKGDAVKQIDWQKYDVTVYTASGKKYAAEKIIVTVPVSILTDIAGRSAINFTPAIDDRIRAAGNIGFGTVIKVIVHFKAPLWKPDTRFIFSEEVIPTWWTQLPLKNNLLTGWAGGPTASRLSQHSDTALSDIVLTSLSHIFNKTIEEIKDSILQVWVFNWLQHEDARGAYSYPTLQTTHARKLLNAPLEDTVFFAGEGLYDGDYPGTVEAAFASGLAVALKVFAFPF